MDKSSGFIKLLLKRKLQILPPLAIGIVAILLAPMIMSKPEQVKVVERAVKVRTLKVTPLAVVPRAVGYGTVKPARTWDAVAEISGQVTFVSEELKDGRSVPAGTELLRIEDITYRLALAQIEAQRQSSDVKDKTSRASLAIAERDLKILSDDYARKKKLADDGVVAKTTVEAAERQLLNAQTQLQNLKNTLEVNAVEREVLAAQQASAGLDLRRTHLIAPFDVRITEVKIGEAQYANKGQLLFATDGLDAAEVEAQFPIGVLRPLISSVIEGGAEPQVGVMALSAVVRLHTATHMAEWTARIDGASGTVDAQTQSIGVVVVIDKPEEQAAPGQRPRLLRNTFMEVELFAPAMEKQVVVPLSALHNGQIYVMDADSRLDIRKVQLHFSQGGFAVLKSGVKPGDTVVISDLPSAIKGMLLDPQEDSKTKRQMIIEATGHEPNEEPQK